MNHFIYLPSKMNYERYPYYTLFDREVYEEAKAIGIIGTATNPDIAPAFINLYECIQDSSGTLGNLMIPGRTFLRDLGIHYLNTERYLPGGNERQYRSLLFHNRSKKGRAPRIISPLSEKSGRIGKGYEMAAFHIGAKKDVLKAADTLDEVPDNTYLFLQIVDRKSAISNLSIDLDRNAYIKDHILYITDESLTVPAKNTAKADVAEAEPKNTKPCTLLGALDISRPLHLNNNDMQLFIQNTIQYAYGI